MGKQHRTSQNLRSHLISEDGSPEDLTSNSKLYNISDKNFWGELLRMIKELKEISQLLHQAPKENNVSRYFPDSPVLPDTSGILRNEREEQVHFCMNYNNPKLPPIATNRNNPAP